MTQAPNGLPGANLVNAGLKVLQRGDRTIEALLVLVGAPRLRAAGLEVPTGAGSHANEARAGKKVPPCAVLEAGETPEIALYRALCAKHGMDAYSRYNALIRRLVSFEHALERMVADQCA